MLLGYTLKRNFLIVIVNVSFSEMFGRNSEMNLLEIKSNTGTRTLHQVSSMTEREQKTLKTELINLRNAIVDSLHMNRLEEIMPMLCLVAYYRCDPMYKYPSFDFVPMLLYCHAVSYSVLMS